MVPGLPWVFWGHFYPGAIGPSGYFLNVLSLGTPAFFNATLVGCAVELFVRVRAHPQGKPIRVWSRKESWVTWLVILAVLSGFGYINFWYYESSLAWRKANPEAAYGLSHPEAQRKYMEEMRVRIIEQRLRMDDQKSIPQLVQAPQSTNEFSRNANPQKEAAPLVSPQPPQSDSITDLIQAASIGNLNKVNELIVEGVDVNAKKFGLTALIIASYKGHKDIVEALLAKGADVNARLPEGHTALMLASEFGYKDIVNALLTKGADVNTKQADGFTVLMFACQHNNLALQDQYYQQKKVQDYKDIVNALLAKGANVNARLPFGHTALILASEFGYKDIVNALLAKGVDVNAKTHDG